LELDDTLVVVVKWVKCHVTETPKGMARKGGADLDFTVHDQRAVMGVSLVKITCHIARDASHQE
jgi:hypothetical protein